MSDLILDGCRSDHVEVEIRPPMLHCITLPIVRSTGEDTGCCVYVASSPFREAPREFLRGIVEEVARRLRVEPDGIDEADVMQGPDAPRPMEDIRREEGM